MNLAVRKLFDDKDSIRVSDDDHEDELVAQPQDLEARPISDLIAKCKSLVTYAKHSTIQGQLKTTLKQSVATRWNSELIMIKSIIQNYTDIKEMLVQKDEYSYLMNDSDISILKQLSNILEEFDMATRIFSSQKKVFLP